MPKVLLIFLLVIFTITCSQDKNESVKDNYIPLENLNIEKYIYEPYIFEESLKFKQMGSIKPYLLPVDPEEGVIDKAIYSALPDSLRPLKDENINTLAVIINYKNYEGKYTDGTSAYSYECTIYLIDLASLRVVGKETFISEPAKVKSKYHKGDTVTRPTKEVIKYLKSFYVGDIEKLGDQEKLIELLKNKKYNLFVRKDAIWQLEAARWQKFLAELAEKDDDFLIRCLAAGKLDPSKYGDILKKIVKKPDENIHVKIEAFGQLNDQKALSKIALNNSNHGITRVLAIQRLTDQEALYQIVHDNSKDHITDNIWVRIEAVKKMNNQKYLVKILNKETKKTIYLEAVKKIKNQGLLRDIVVDKGYNPTIRGQAVARLRDKNLLKRISLSDKSFYVRIQAFWKLGNQTKLEKIAKDNKDGSLRSEAVKRLKNKQVIHKIAEQDPDYKVRKVAICQTVNEEDIVKTLTKLKKQKYLADIAKNDSHIFIRLEAVRRMDDQELLFGLVKSNAKIRYKAILMIGDQGILVKIALDDKLDKKIRIEAIIKLENEQLLKKIAHTCQKDPELLKAVNKQLTKITQ